MAGSWADDGSRIALREQACTLLVDDVAEDLYDAETLLRASKRPLVLGMGGGGDVVGALATAEFARLYDDADPVLGGLTWERRQIDPTPGPRSAAESCRGSRVS